MRLDVRFAVAVSFLLVVTVTSCSSDEDGGDGTSAPPTTVEPTTTDTVEPTTPPTDEPTEEPTVEPTGPQSGFPADTTQNDPDLFLEDGRHFAYVTEVDVDGERITFDLAQFFTGDEAVAAAKEDGVIPPDQDFIENDYYIRNVNPRLRTLELPEGFTLLVVNWADCCDLTHGDPAAWEHSFETEPFSDPAYPGPISPYWLVLGGGKVLTVEEQYLP